MRCHRCWKGHRTTATTNTTRLAYRHGKSIRRLARSRRLSEVDASDYSASPLAEAIVNALR